MDLVYLGTGAAEGIPALFCNCEYCKAVRKRGGREVRSRSQIVIDGELSIDFPPDAFYHGALLGAELDKIRYLLVTHSHMDHFYAHDFVLRGYKYARQIAPLDIYGNEEVLSVFEECTRREMRKDVRSLITLHRLEAFSPVRFGNWRAVPLPATHTSKEPFIYLLEKENKRILHLTDTGSLHEECFSYLEREGKPLDLITFDCTFLFDPASENARHMGLTENEKIFLRLQDMGLANENTKKVLTHFSHNGAPDLQKLSLAEQRFCATAAYDGMRLTI